MRVVGVVTKLGLPPGLYVRQGVDEQRVTGAWEQYRAFVDAASSPRGLGAGVAAQVGARAAAGALAGAMVPGGLALGAALGPAAALYLLYANWDRIRGKPPLPLKRLEQARMPGPEADSHVLPSQSIVLQGKLLAGDYRDFDGPVFHGLFSSDKQLKQLMEAEGGHSELHVVDQATANTHYRHPFSGTFGTGLHVPHPKAPECLVPLAGMNEVIKEEIVHEWGEIVEALGARRLVIADTTGIKVKGTASNLSPGGSVEAQMKAAYGSSVVEVSEYAAGTFDPERATSNRRWLGDHPAIVKMVRGRIHGNQTSWRRTIKVDVTAGIGLNVVALAAPSMSKAALKLEYHRTFDFFVEFHPKEGG